MDELLKNAIGTRLAFEIALATKADARQVQMLHAMYQDIVSLANLVDADQAPVDTATGTTWDSSRFSFPFGTYYRPIVEVT
jgi:hypothetical protein